MTEHAESDGSARARGLRIIAGPCVLQDGQAALEVAAELVRIREDLAVPVTFKASFDKANRTRGRSYRGPGLARGLELLAEVRRASGLPLLTDIHEPGQAEPVAAVVDVLQIPAFLARQTDLIVAAARTGRPVNLKKAQFMAPDDVVWAVEKARDAGCETISVTERGTCFGYHDLVVDPRGLHRLLELGRRHGFEVIFDATHAAQLPSAGEGGLSGGDRRLVPPLARAAAAVGVSSFYFETYPDPDSAPSDGPNALVLAELRGVVAMQKRLVELCGAGA